MREKYKLALLGFGNVGRAFAQLLRDKKSDLKRDYNVSFLVVGIATGSHGIAIDPGGINLTDALTIYASGGSLDKLSKSRMGNSGDFIHNCGADVLFETTPVNYKDGQPALRYLKTGLEEGMHVITANKGPVVHGYRQLMNLAQDAGRAFLFESTVMDGPPVFSMARCGLPAAEIKSIHGILNSTTNFILGQMEKGESLDDAITRAQEMEIAESDPRGDVDGWDAAVKVAALATVLMGHPLKPDEVDRTGIRNINEENIERAKRSGRRWKLVCSAQRTDNPGNPIAARVAPQMVAPDSSLYHISGTSAVLQIESDVLGKLTLGEKDPTPTTTAYGLLADLLNAIHRRT